MNHEAIFNQISEEADRFYERTMRQPDVALVGIHEWAQIRRHSLFVNATRVQVMFSGGSVEVREVANVYSMIGIALKEL